MNRGTCVASMKESKCPLDINDAECIRRCPQMQTKCSRSPRMVKMMKWWNDGQNTQNVWNVRMWTNRSSEAFGRLSLNSKWMFGYDICEPRKIGLRKRTHTHAAAGILGRWMWFENAVITYFIGGKRKTARTQATGSRSRRSTLRQILLIFRFFVLFSLIFSGCPSTFGHGLHCPQGMRIVLSWLTRIGSHATYTAHPLMTSNENMKKVVMSLVRSSTAKWKNFRHNYYHPHDQRKEPEKRWMAERVKWNLSISE